MSAPATERIHTITGGGGVRLHLRDRGPEDAPAILFLHGWSQAHMCWQAQMDSDLARTHRLLALDLRGHGASDKPEDPAAYADGALWARDIAAVIETLGLHRPVLVGWSYAGRVIGEYLARHGDTALGGLMLAGAIPASGAARPDWMMGPESPGRMPGLVSLDQPRCIDATVAFVRACTAEPLPPEVHDRFLAFNMLCPPHARRGLGIAESDTRPAYARVTCPAIVVHGALDRVVSPACAEEFARLMPNARIEIFDAIGHAPFIEAPERFNALLGTLVREVKAAA